MRLKNWSKKLNLQKIKSVQKIFPRKNTKGRNL